MSSNNLILGYIGDGLEIANEVRSRTKIALEILDGD